MIPTRTITRVGRGLAVILLLSCLIVVSGGLAGRAHIGHAAPGDTPTPTATATKTAATPTATETPVASPVTVNVHPSPAGAGSMLTVTGSGFKGGEQVALELATTGANPAITQLVKTTADGAGAISDSSVTLPADTPAGSYTLIAVGLTSNRSAQAAIQVTAPTATLSVTPTSFGPDDTVKVSGTNYLPGEAITISLINPAGTTSFTLGQANASNTGAFGPVSVQIPFGVPAGTLQLHATGKTSNRDAMVAVTVSAPATTLTVAPTSAKPGDKLTLSGGHFKPGETITLDLVSLSSSTRIGTATADTGGNFSAANLVVPANTPEGTVTLVATGTSSHLSATAQLAVGVLPASLTLSSPTVTAGKTEDVSGAGFIAGETVTIVMTGTHLASLTLATAPVGTDGRFAVKGLGIPSFIPAGSYSVAAFGQKSGRSAAATLTVQAPPPSAPILSILGITSVSGHPDVLSPGGQVQVAGSHFPAGTTVIVALTGANGTTTLGSVKTNAQGTLGPVTLSIPANTPTGAATLEAVISGNKVASVGVTVAVLSPHLSVSSGDLAVNSTITVQGSGFAPGEQVVLALNSAALVTSPATVVADASGAFTAHFTVPGTITQGTNILTATGATSRSSASVSLQAARMVATTWYFAHGDTSGGNRTVISLLNPTSGQAKVSLTFLYQFAAQRSDSVVVPAHSALRVDLGLAAGHGRQVSTIVSADRQIGAQSTIYYGNGDATAALGASAPGKLWYLAEGYTGGSFHEYLSVMNPTKSYANVDVRFLPFNGRPPKEVRFSVRPLSNIRIDAGQYMPAASISAIVSADQGIVVERTLRFGAGGRGAHDKIGIATSSTVWLFAQGNTSSGRQTFLTVLNPNQAAAATVTATLFDGTGKPVGTRTIVVDPLHRGNIKINNIVGSAEVAVAVSSSVPVVVERPQYLGSPNLSQADAGSDVFGRNGAGMSWTFPAGDTANGNQETLYLYNPGLKAADVTATFYTGDGTIVQRTMTLAPNSRTVMAVNGTPGLPTGIFGVVLRGTNGQLFVAEQSTTNPAARLYTGTQGIAQ